MPWKFTVISHSDIVYTWIQMVDFPFVNGLEACRSYFVGDCDTPWESQPESARIFHQMIGILKSQLI